MVTSLQPFRRFLLVIVVVLASIFMPTPMPTIAAGTWYVSANGSDSNNCLSRVTPCLTINGAIAKATSSGTIYVAEGVYTNTGAAVVQINKNVSLSGGWNTYFTSQESMSVIDGQYARKGMIIAKDVTTSIENMEIIHGLGDPYGGAGGITINNNATVSLTDSLVQEVQSYGGIYSTYADLTLVRTIIRNSHDQGIINYLGTLRMVSSAIISNTYGILSNGTTFIENSTISGNLHGGIAMGDCNGTISISSSTVTQNGDFGLRTYWCNSAVLQNTILAGNISTTNPDCTGPFQSYGYNIIGNTDGCDFTPTSGDLVNIDAKLGPLQDNGGSTPTHALLLGSPAIDAGDPAGCTGSPGPLITDQRGASRLGICDIGAYEFGGTLVSLNASSNPPVVGQPITLTARVVEGEAGTPTGTVTFAYEGGNLGSGSLDGTGTASLEDSTLTLGNHKITATYSGDSNFAGSTSLELDLNVGYSTAISITTDNPDSSVVGQPISISFNVTSNQGTPTGTVFVVSDVGSHVCSAMLSNGVGSCQIIFTETGPITLTATYIGEANFATSYTTEPHIVNKADTTTTIVAGSPDPSNPGQKVMVNYSVVVDQPGAGMPNGTVTINASDGPESCSGLLVGDSGSCEILLIKSGLRTLSASYEGDNLFNGSISEGQSHQVNYLTLLPLISKPCSPLYNDDFSNPASGWPVGDDGKYLSEYVDGEYRILVRPTQGGALAIPGFQASDYSVSVDLRNRNGVMGSYGIAFGSSGDGSSFYSLEIYPNGWYGIYRNELNGAILSEAYSSAINQGKATNRITVERNGTSIKAYANGQLLASVTDGTYTGSLYLGLVVLSYDQQNVDIRFDNFTVYSIRCGGSSSSLNTMSGWSTSPDSGFFKNIEPDHATRKP